MTARPLKHLTREALEPLWSRHDISTDRIAAALGVTRQAVSYKARSLGLPSREKNRKRLADDETFTRMWRAGVSCSDIAQHFGYSCRSAVTARRRSLNLPPRTRGRGGNNHGGWVETITLREFAEMELARKMKASVGRGLQ